MAVALSELVQRYRDSLNAPGESFVSGTEDQIVSALANGFWQARLRGAFVGYRVQDGTDVVPVAPETDELPEELHQLIVLFAALLTLEAKLLALTTHTRAKAGPVESERRRSAEVLVALLKARRAELEEIKNETVNGGPGVRTSIAVIDSYMARTCAIADGYTSWVG